MKSRVTALLTAALLAVGLIAAPAAADVHASGPPPHGHVFLLHATWTGSGPATDLKAYQRCVDLAGGQSIPAHHDTVHTGRAGEALQGAGHLVVPTAQLGPIDDCAQLEALLPPTRR